MTSNPEWHARALLAVALAFMLVSLRGFLPLHTLPSRGDPSLPFQGSDLTPQWFPWLKVAVDALRTGTMPVLGPVSECGSPTV